MEAHHLGAVEHALLIKGEVVGVEGKVSARLQELAQPCVEEMLRHAPAVVDHLLRVVGHDERPFLKVAKPVERGRLDPRRELECLDELAQRVLHLVVGEVHAARGGSVVVRVHAHSALHNVHWRANVREELEALEEGGHVGAPGQYLADFEALAHAQRRGHAPRGERGEEEEHARLHRPAREPRHVTAPHPPAQRVLLLRLGLVVHGWLLLRRRTAEEGERRRAQECTHLRGGLRLRLVVGCGEARDEVDAPPAHAAAVGGNGRLEDSKLEQEVDRKADDALLAEVLDRGHDGERADEEGQGGGR
mmetsp:Transcript_15765/g.42353  ORF Transcript_15765/g.42353 Transcript_15765/m.42353 type:complete len:305 (+) Transcript_15765:828-1742(+)